MRKVDKFLAVKQARDKESKEEANAQGKGRSKNKKSLTA